MVLVVKRADDEIIEQMICIIERKNHV